jgi:hypothetical protein
LAPHPPAVEFTGRCGAGFGTTVPSCVVPCDVHSQYPPTGMVVAHVNLPAWQMLTANAGAALSAKAAAREQIRRMTGAFLESRKQFFFEKRTPLKRRLALDHCSLQVGSAPKGGSVVAVGVGFDLVESAPAASARPLAHAGVPSRRPAALSVRGMPPLSQRSEYGTGSLVSLRRLSIQALTLAASTSRPAATSARAPEPMSKSFLVLFFKKELLSSSNPAPKPPADAPSSAARSGPSPQ